MLLLNINDWELFCILFSLLLIVTFMMMRQSRNFYTKDVVLRKFSIMELEIPATPHELYNLIKGIYSLPAADSAKTIQSLKAQLRLDFLFMPLAYGSVSLLCRRVAGKMETDLGKGVFIAFAILQAVSWACDIIENIYLLGKIRPDITNPSKLSPAEQAVANKKHKRYLWMEAAKWGIALTAVTCAISILFYFWVTGNFSSVSFHYLLFILTEIIIFIFLSAKARKPVMVSGSV